MILGDIVIVVQEGEFLSRSHIYFPGHLAGNKALNNAKGYFVVVKFNHLIFYLSVDFAYCRQI